MFLSEIWNLFIAGLALYGILQEKKTKKKQFLLFLWCLLVLIGILMKLHIL